ncbi:MAG TPA: MDR family MFS transporter [Candidatus Limnocylindrales bacterium]|jgi:EmrB/QacA subfamily drug resistance transporter|nr:MDR family MFS transporter [Candidatus Limnocylindrales bacterium]
MESFPVENGGTAPSVADDPALGLSQRAKLEILGAVLLGLFLVALDQTIVGTALPKIVTSLGGNELYTWVVTIYLLTSTITVPFYGKLSDIYGRRPMLMIGISLFLIGSVLSGLSQEMWQLILFRGIQGLGAGALFPIALAVIGDLFTPAERGKYQGLFGAVFGISFLIGPGLGGFLTDNVGWHWIFFVNVPIGIVSLFVIWRLLPTIKRAGASRNLDYLGALVFTIGIGFLLVGLTNKAGFHPVGTQNLPNDWTEPVVGGFIAIGLLLSALFVFVESRAKEPIVPLDLWRNRTYVSSILATFFVSFGFFGAIIFLPRWFQVVRHESATNSGYLIFPMLIGLIGSSIIAGALVSRTGKYKAIVLSGLIAIVVGIALMTNLRADTEYPALFLWMFIAGLGIGPSLSVFTIVVQNAVPFSKLGVATSNLTFFRQIGGSVGLAIAGTQFGTALGQELPGQLAPVTGQILAGVPQQFQGQAVAAFQSVGSTNVNLNDLTGVGQSFGGFIVGHVPTQFQAFVQPYVPQLDQAFNNAMSLAIAQTFWIGVAAGIAALVAAVFMRELPLRSTNAAPAAAAPEAAGRETGQRPPLPAAD